MLPIGLLAWVGWRMTQEEEQRLQRQLRQLQTKHLADLRGSLADLMVELEQGFLEEPGLFASADAQALREHTRKRRFVRQLFLMSDEGPFLYPDLTGTMTDREREFFIRTRSIWNLGERLDGSGDDPTIPDRSHGWHTWFWGNGMQFLFWRKGAGDRLEGFEVDRVALFSEIIARLPPTQIIPSGLEEERITLSNERGNVFYQWGNYEPKSGESATVSLPLEAPLQMWTLQSFSPAAGGIQIGSLLNLVSGFIAIGGLLAGLGYYFYRENSRQFKQAAQRVSFVNQVSHELKTPLTSMRMHAELLLEKLLPEDTPLRRHAAIVVEESQRLSRLINNVLTFSKSRKAPLVIHPRRVLIDEVISSTLAHFHPVLTAKGIQTDFDLDAKHPVLVDSDALEQIIGNLVSNVEKYAADGKFLKIVSRQECEMIVTFR